MIQATESFQRDLSGIKSVKPELILLANYLQAHPEFKQTLNIPIETAQHLLPSRLLEVAPAGATLELRVGKKQSTGFLDIMIIDSAAQFDPIALKKSFRFPESRDRNDFASPLENGQPVLYSQISRLNSRPDILVLGTLDIRKDYQGKGVGQDYQKRLGDFARTLGFTAIVGEAVDADALAFDKRSGYSEVKDRTITNLMLRQGLCGNGEIPVILSL